MANAFTNYFETVGSIFKEKNAWYRILTVILISIIYQFSYTVIGHPDKFQLEEFNLPLVILIILCGILLCGYQLQIFSDRMNRSDLYIPKINFLQMFINGLKAIPFSIVWGFYIFVIAFVPIILCVTLGAVFSGLKFLLILICIALAFVIIPAFYPVIAVFAKDFSYKKGLNPALIFRAISDVLLKVYAIMVASIIALVLLIIAVCCITIPFIKSFMSMQPEILFALGTILVVAFVYVAQVLNYASFCAIADATYETMYEVDDKENEKKNDSQDVINSNVTDGYMHNSDQE